MCFPERNVLCEPDTSESHAVNLYIIIHSTPIDTGSPNAPGGTAGAPVGRLVHLNAVKPPLREPRSLSAILTVSSPRRSTDPTAPNPLAQA